MSGIAVFQPTQMGASLSASSISFSCVGSGGSGLHVGNYAGFNDEQSYQTTTYVAGTYSGMYVNNYSLNTLAGASTITFRPNSTNGSQSVTINAGATGEFTDGTDSDSSTGTPFAYKLTTGGSGSTSIGFGCFGELFTPTSSSSIYQRFNTDGPNNSSHGGYASSGVTYYAGFGGQASSLSGSLNNTTKANAEFTAETSATLANLQAPIQWTAGTVTINTLINGSTGSQSISANTNALWADATDADSLVGGATTLAFSCSTTNVASGQSLVAVDFTSSGTAIHYIAAEPGGVAFAAGTTSYVAITSRLQNSTTENIRSVYTQTSFVASALSVYSSANANTGTSTITFRVGGSNGSQSTTFASGVTGYKTDATDSDSVTKLQEIDEAVVTPNSGGSLTLTLAGFLATFAKAAQIWPYLDTELCGGIQELGMGM
jgi:hypothetical protein